MKENYNLLCCLDEKNYKENGSKFQRTAVRAVIRDGNRIAMIRSSKYGEYKFPGGGMEKTEQIKDTIKREVEEETGLTVISDSLKYLGSVVERRKGEKEDIFEMLSHYYECMVKDSNGMQKLDAYEAEYGYKLEYISLEEAIINNEGIKDISNIPWIKRDTEVMKLLTKAAT
ncbi:NUDIX hydrolase [Anaerosacchariphilus polymeriproducens]|uniref:NUDIX domain-containing protein n=1 Tax=Anaerosacchariphilus polymeriproducens TaxID=1812858 RepID=A0A371AS44_9FIRM|nr:NUDIX domain-containing protein [Anaerosacchariphilus polymeriproducens]RDU22374.1 NUDIX domain-containing protein [Anaerosacchariphilus polymeriproducens]